MTNENAPLRLTKIMVELNVGLQTIKDFLNKKGIEANDLKPTSKIEYHVYEMLLKEFQSEKSIKQQSMKTAVVPDKKETSSSSSENVVNANEVSEISDSKNIDTISASDTKKNSFPKVVGNIKIEPKVKESSKEIVEPKVEVNVPNQNPKEEIVDSNNQALIDEVSEPEISVPPKVDEVEEKSPEIVEIEKPIKEEIVELEIPKEENEIKISEVAVENHKTNEEIVSSDEIIVDIKKETEIETLRSNDKIEGIKMPKLITKIELDENNNPIKPSDKNLNVAEADNSNNEISKDKSEEIKKIEVVEKSKELPIEKTEEVKKTDNRDFSKKADFKDKEKSKEKVEETKKEEIKEVIKEEKTENPVSDKNIETTATTTPVVDTSNNFQTQYEKLSGPTIVGKIDLNQFKKAEKTDKKGKDGKVPVASSQDDKFKKRKRKRIVKDEAPKPATPNAPNNQNAPSQKSGDKPRHKPQDNRFKKDKPVVEVSQEDIQKQIKETLARLTTNTKSKGAKYRRQKRDDAHVSQKAEMEEMIKQQKILKVTEFLTANDLALMMNVHVNQIISTCLNLGLFVSINQRLDAEAITLVADEFGFDVEFIQADTEEEETIVDREEDLIFRHPVVTVMGHVDHGKTSLLDYIRKANVIAGEAGGITQHIGAYEVVLHDGKKITFLDTPGHEAFTAMRARGAKLTDIAIIVIAADDRVMPQTIEAINHARAAGVPMVFAINKVDRPAANPEKIKEELSMMNILVEDWGGKFQNQEISAKQGTNIDLLLDKVLFEAEMLELRANPNRLAVGTVIESSLEKGRGYVAKILIQNGTLSVGDIAVAGSTHGKVKAMFNERNQPIKKAGPSTPVLMLGLDGAPQAGDKFQVYETEKEAKSITNKRQQLIREQGLRTQKHITLDEIGRRIAIGDFKELNVIVKGDVDGSIEALSDSLLKLSTSKIQVNIIHKSVGQISESDVLLASASDAIIVGFQVRPSLSARKLAESEQIDIRTYSVIYNAIEEIKSAMEGMLSPTLEEKIVANVEVRDVFKITKVGTVAGCMVLDGKIHRNTKVRIIRDGIVIYNGSLSTLKRFKDDVKEVSTGYECGLSIENFNDLKVKDIIEGYEIIEKKATL